MKIKTIAFALLSLAGTAMITSCGNGETGDPAQDASANQGEAVQEKSDGQTTYTQEMIDSLNFTRSVKPVNGIYLVTKSSTRSIDLIPAMEPWENLTNRLRTFNDTVNPSKSWIVYHRVENFPIRTAKKPLKLEETEDGYQLFVPFDSATATKLKLLRSRWPENDLTVLVDGRALNVFSDKESLNAEGVTLKSWHRPSLEEIKEVLSN